MSAVQANVDTAEEREYETLDTKRRARPLYSSSRI